MTDLRSSRNGISLLEVLISIGILAVGLTSVLSFIPAGHSMAKTSLVTDQAAMVAANAHADIVTQGYLRVDSLSNVTSPIMIDPVGAATWTGLGFTQAVLRSNGVLAVPATPSPARTGAVASYLIRSRDDVAFDVPDSDALDVTNQFANGSRSYRGNFSWTGMLSKTGGGAFSPGDEAKLTIVVYHNRDASQSPVPSTGFDSITGTYLMSSGSVAWPVAGQLVPSRNNAEVIRTNGVCLVRKTSPPEPPSFRRISIAAVNDADTGAFIEFEGPQPVAGDIVTVYIIPDAVAVIEKTVTLEASSPYSE